MSKDNTRTLFHLICYIFGTCDLVQASQFQYVQQDGSVELILQGFFFIYIFIFIELCIGYVFRGFSVPPKSKCDEKSQRNVESKNNITR